MVFLKGKLIGQKCFMTTCSEFREFHSGNKQASILCDLQYLQNLTLPLLAVYADWGADVVSGGGSLIVISHVWYLEV